jgi:squalene-hopene/tetraprenyl-beta-curcumene cyclase
MSSLALFLQDDEQMRQEARAGLEWLSGDQNEDGGWGDAEISASSRNATVLSFSALQYCAPQEYAAQIERGHRWIRKEGGFPVINDPRQMSMSGPGRFLYALAGFVDWGKVRKLPTEVVLLPPRIRRTVSITFSSILSLAVLQESCDPAPRWRRPLRKRAVREAIEWLRHAQGVDGGYGESAMLSSITAVCFTLAGVEEPGIINRALRFLRDSQWEDGSWPMDRDLENFDTAQAVFAYHEAGKELSGEGRVREWLVEGQDHEGCFHTDSPPGGWAWARPAGWPDTDDTAYTLRALRLLGVPPEDDTVREGMDWIYRMQNTSGAWPTFVRNSRVPFDRGCPYVTAHVLSAFAQMGPEDRNSGAVNRALEYLRNAQNEDGSLGSLWFREFTWGTAAVVEALADFGLESHPVFSPAVEWLVSHRNPDGGWGDGKGAPSSAEETARAVGALLRSGRCREVESGVRWLLENQREDGRWNVSPVGVYFSSIVYYNTFYALTYPLIALSRYRALCG